MSDTSDLLVQFWQTIKEYIPLKDRQIAADHVINELIDLGIGDDDLNHLAVDKVMQNAISEHVDLDLNDDDEDE